MKPVASERQVFCVNKETVKNLKKDKAYANTFFLIDYFLSISFMISRTTSTVSSTSSAMTSTDFPFASFF